MSSEASNMFRPPVNRAMRMLDRSYFCKDALISAAGVFDMKKLSGIRGEVMKSNDILALRQIFPIQPDPYAASRKCILLRPDIRYNDKSTWSETITNLVGSGDINLIPYTLRLDYKHWNTHDILSSILPTALLDDLPTAFSHAGHIAQLNLRDAYVPYKNLIGEVLIDKNPSIRTVINKVETLGEENEYRVLDYELVAGEDDMQVEAKEWGCTFRFDYSKVFWNSRLSTEHQRLVDKFEKGEVVCDVMAGVGPFAIPAAKKGVFVWANDLNPDCFDSLVGCVTINKVVDFVTPLKEDGHTFIPTSASRLLSTTHAARIPLKISRTEAANLKPVDRFTTIPQPKHFSHYVMNLPSTAIEFLPDFIGLYSNLSRKLSTELLPLPMIHCYCFGPKNEDDDPQNMAAKALICAQISEKLGTTISPETPEVEIWDVRDVAPKKRQFCASFRLPQEVAFRETGAATVA